jgi:hypothetical protein
MCRAWFDVRIAAQAVELAITGLEKQGFEAELVDDDDDDNGALSLACRLSFLQTAWRAVFAQRAC